MKRFSLILVLLLLFAAVNVSTAQNDDGTISVECEDGGEFNGVEVTVFQMRPGFSYTATVLGINDFDPILAVLNEGDSGTCTDDTPGVDELEAELPSTGEIDGSDNNVQIRFNNGNSNDFNDVRLVVGGEDDEPGEFLLILQGMAVTEADGLGDIFIVRLNEPTIESEVNVTAYAISITDSLDPLLFLVDGDGETIQDGDDQDVQCDDAGSDSLCWGESEELSDSFVPLADGTRLGGYSLDSMLSLPLEDLEANTFFNFVVNSYNNSTFGDYVIAFHIAIGEGTGSSTSSGK
ncbi:MAG: hypothetical protein SF029_26860 [bacterium]|nr:hypothetical protein [bacterium]